MCLFLFIIIIIINFTRQRSCVTLQIALIIPEQPNSKPFSNFVSDPGKIKKFGILSFSYKL